ncbi:hypothetical protein ATM17_12785 [Sphingopyxis macrogoltabida]|uniref:Uncharacterized protein n=2 Tax=Sphingopyxis macrogoltabida TaxID=33050 RepID=A0AAC9AVC0_SPHMC|nr:hypothetical protein LH19_07040 [Sphingopyxis macrogoltabida]AMU89912.1 hypothetical protein ATM17_12785 [Sphingopyxis macrogoltabida]
MDAGGEGMTIPADFNPALTMKQSAKIHGVSPTAIFKWRKKLGYVARDDLWTDDDIRRLKSLYSGSSLNDIAAALGRSVSAVKSKAVSLGLRRATGQFAPDRAPKISGRVQGVADMAAQHLRRDAPTFRCDANGKANPKGKFWRFGNITLTEDDMLAKAERKGWSADAWREIA